MSAVPAVRAATYDDVLASAEGVTAELIDGELFLSPRPRFRHRNVQVKLAGRLDDQFGDDEGDGPGGWWILLGLWVLLRTVSLDQKFRAVPFDAVAIDPRRWWPKAPATGSSKPRARAARAKKAPPSRKAKGTR